MNNNKAIVQPKQVKRGEIYFADLGETIGSEQAGHRPVLVVQNKYGNKYSPTVVIVSVTSQISKAKIPTHVEIGTKHGMLYDSVILFEQIRTIDKSRLKRKITELNDDMMVQVNEALELSIGLLI